MKKTYLLLLILTLSIFGAQTDTRLFKHTVKKHETLTSIAQKCGTTVKVIREMNNMSKKDVLKYGRTIIVPIKVFVSSTGGKEKITPIFHKVNRPKVLQTKRVATLKKKKTHKAHKSSSKGIKVITLAKTKLGRKYVWGAQGKNVFDCSGLTQYVYKKQGINIPRRAIWQSKFGKRVSRKNLQKGDLVFFDTSKKRKGYVNHVGIYIGDNKFIHASSAKKKVIITSLNKQFYSKRFTGGRRVAL